ncbi:MAG: YsnF/AvaK domain-containing protein [Acidobacteriota bacterium]|nr:YsnF/AvaK domain-containing protein [Acidobacteriota bacterium]
MATTLVGIFDDYSAAQKAVQELTKAGIKQGEISIARNEPAGKGYTTYGGVNSEDYTTGTSIGNKISNFFDSIFGTDINDDERGVYAESVRRGSTIVVVNADKANVDETIDILNRAGAVNVDQRHAQYRAAGYKKFDAKAPLYNAEQTKTEIQNYAGQGEIALPVIEEQLAVGKRVVQRGGVRVHTRVTERPVEASVTLREEHVNVERHKVDRAASDADFAAVQTGEFSVNTKSEVPVVAKEARIVEEVVVGKNVSERQETVRDTVKRTDVQVQDVEIDADRQSKKAGN